VISLINENLHVSGRELSRDLHVSRRSVHRMLKTLKYNDYNICRKCVISMQQKILTTTMNLNICGGILGIRVTGPYIFEDHLNGQSYLNFL